MNGALVLLAVGVAVGGIIYAATRTKAAPPGPTTGKVTLDTSPEGALIIQNSSVIGYTPFDVDMMPGVFDLVLSLAGYQDYPLRLTVRAGQSFSKTITLTPVSNPPPIPSPSASFTASPHTGVVPLAVQFTDGSTGTISSRVWDFGDGITSGQASPSHTYQSPGTYTTILTVSGPGGSSTATTVITVTSPPPLAPIAIFTFTPHTGSAPLTVQFADLSTGVISSWDWDFGDGTSSTVESPSHVYQNPGNYTAKLTVSGPGGSNSASIVITVTTPPPAGPVLISGTDNGFSIVSGSWAIVSGTLVQITIGIKNLSTQPFPVGDITIYINNMTWSFPYRSEQFPAPGETKTFTVGFALSNIPSTNEIEVKATFPTMGAGNVTLWSGQYRLPRV